MKQSITIITIIILGIAFVHCINNRDNDIMQNCISIHETQSLECVEHDEPIKPHLVDRFDKVHDLIHCNDEYYLYQGGNFHCE